MPSFPIPAFAISMLFQVGQRMKSSPRPYRWRYLLQCLPLLVLLSGCTQLRSFYPLPEVELQMQVKPSNRPGIYTITGQSNLPEDTPIAVAAVRYLQLGEQAMDESNPPTYSILAYQPVTIQKGQWQTEINLWQVAPDGRYQETWQLEQPKLKLAVQPEEKVVFLATLTPENELSGLEQELARRGIRLPRGSVFSTSEGFRYAQVQYLDTVALPTGRTTPPPERPEDRNGGWGDRYIIPQEPQNEVELELPESRKTNAPARPEEFLW